MRLSVALSIVCLTISELFAAPALAAEPQIVSLAKDGPWVANFDEDSCQLLGKFGNGADSIIARFTRYAPNDRFELSLMGESLDRYGQNSKVQLTFGPGLPERDAWPDRATLGNKPMMIFDARIDGWIPPNEDDNTPPPFVSPQQEAAVSTLTLRLDQSHGIRLELGSMGKPMAMMRTCMDALLKHWGYGPAMISGISRLPIPKGNPATWAKSSDYPSRSIAGGHQGLVWFRLDIDEAGKVTGCSIPFRTNPDDFADLTCKLLRQRARFRPALDAQGKPVKWFYVNRVRWTIPPD